MKKIKKLIIVLCIVLIMILVIMCILQKKSQLNENGEFIEGVPDVAEDFIEELGKVKGYSTFFSVEKMLSKYIEAIQYSDSIAIYNIMDSTYISNNNITQEDVLENISHIVPYASKITIREMYEQKNSKNAVYYIDCILEKKHNAKNFYFTLYKDEQNSTYSIEQIDEQTYKKRITKNDEEIEIKEIGKNEYNKSIFVEPTEKERVTKYFEDFLRNALYYPDYAYNLLNSEYKNKCFATLQDFKDYIENKREVFESYFENSLKSFEDFESIEEYQIYIGRAKKLELKKYQIRMGEEYNRYICIDTEGNYYTFYATSAFNYTIVLGNYAIPTEDFTQEYNSSLENEKGILNIERFFRGINDKNYGYSYSVLSKSFKNNKYQTKEEFVNYAKQNFFEENKIEYIEYKKENGVYIYKIKVTDATRKSSEEKAFNMIVKLNNGTDFEMSFGEN